MKRPNFLFVFSDQHRFCDLGCYGNNNVHTPNIDAFAAKSAVLEQFYSNCPVCVPARGTLLTGQYPLNHGAITNDFEVKKNVESIANVWNRAGYETAYIGKWHLGGVPRDKKIASNERLGFKYWRGCNCNHDYANAWYDDNGGNRHKINGYEPVEQTNLALDYLRSESATKSPWALMISFGTPHEPYNLAPPRLLEKYNMANVPFRDNVHTPARLATTDISEELLKEWYSGYYSHITALDEQFGRLITFLESSGQINDTVIVYTSDHGDMLGSKGLTNKQWPYEESAHVPFLLRYDGHVSPGRRNQLMSLVDVAPTIAALAGLSFQCETDGTDLSNVFLTNNGKGAEYVYLLDPIPSHQAYDRGSKEWRALRVGPYLYARTPYDNGWLLYNNEQDPLQNNNLINNKEYQNVKEDLDVLLLSVVQKYDAFLPWDEWIFKFNLLNQWNRSQEYFNYPILKP